MYNFLAEKLRWAECQPWCIAMRQCRQDPRWHAEGDVWTHTRMTCAALDDGLAGCALPAEDVQVLKWAALLHDIGKPQTTIEDGDIVHSPHHTKVGAHLARGVLMAEGIPFTIRERACALIRYHAHPMHAYTTANPAEEVIRTSWLAGNALLHHLANADLAGRIGRGRDEGRTALALWQEECRRHGCWETPFVFASSHARVQFFRGRLHTPYDVPYHAGTPRVIMLAGLPASGKTTWADRHAGAHTVIELDRIREELHIPASAPQGSVIREATLRLRDHLAARHDLCFVATNLVAPLRRRWLDMFLDFGCQVILRYFEPSLPLILARNAARPCPVPTPVVEKMIQKMEVPNWSEVHELVVDVQ